jgi:hypothetical protein
MEPITPDATAPLESVDGEGSAVDHIQPPGETPSSTRLSETSDGIAVQDVVDPRLVSTTPKVPLFRQGKISIAVDVSGSTYGSVIQAEIKAIRSICSLFPSALRSAIKILPWSDQTEAPSSLDDIDELDSNGGTDPSCLLDDDACRYELQNSSFWFLMTDGDILEGEVRKFATNLVNYGLHGLASVVAIFGERESLPSKCNISVGLSVFATSPHCAFLYTDVETGYTYILQTKGCFSALLPKGTTNPKLGPNTLWTELPRTSYENLSRVPIPPPQSVSKDEVILGDNSKINLSALLSNPSINEQIVSLILDNEENMKTIALTAKVKGQSEQFQKWLDSVEKTNEDALNPHRIERPQADEKSTLLTEVMGNLMVSGTPNDNLLEVQKELREANARDLEALDSLIHRTESISHHRKSSEFRARQISMGSIQVAEDNIGSVGYQDEEQRQVHFGPPNSTRRLDPIRQSGDHGVHVRSDSLMNPGFQKPKIQKDYYNGQCMLCASSQHVIALLLRKPPDDQHPATTNFPQPESFSGLLFPMTMGNYPETDIISPLLACDPCSFGIVKKGWMPSGEKIIAALPLVSFSKNRAAWVETIKLATQKRFDIKDLPLVFLAILYTNLERLLEDKNSKAAVALRPAFNWACGMILQEAEFVDLDVSPKTTPASYLLRIFHNLLDSTYAVELLMYPIDGFIVANVALSDSLHKMKIIAPKRARIVFYRFLYHLTEQYFKLGSESGELVRHATMVIMLIFDDRAGPRSLLTLEALRQLSVKFSDEKEMMEAVQTHLNWRPRRFKPKKLSISVRELLDTPLLDAQSLRSFRRLGPLFTWIEDKAAHAIAAYLHYLFCFQSSTRSPIARFIEMRKKDEIETVMSSPEEMSAKKVEDLIKVFPPVL